MVKNKRVAAIIQARMGSSRLPGKVMADICGKPSLWHIVNRLKHVPEIDLVAVATSTNHENDIVEEYCRTELVPCFRGSEDDVLDRYYQAAKKFSLSDIVRITGDCPMIDPEVIDKVIDLYQGEYLDYASNVIPPTFPDGLDAEIFSIKALERTWKETTLKSEREHVTVYMWQNPNLFKQNHLQNKIDLSKRRWTLDEPRDYKFMEETFNRLYPIYPKFRLKDLLKFFDDHPEIEKINNDINRNEGLEKSFKEDNIL